MDWITFSIFCWYIEEQHRFTELALTDMAEVVTRANQLRARSNSLGDTVPDDFERMRQLTALSDQIGALEQRAQYSIQAYLTAIANISKVFWPPTKEKRVRGRILRRIFDLDESSLFAPSKLTSRGIPTARDMRDHAEHFDERIDDYTGTGGPGTIAIRSPLNAGLSASGDRFTLRAFDAETLTITLVNEDYCIAPLITETREVARKIKDLRVPLAHWKFDAQRVENPLTGAWIERAAFDQKHAERFGQFYPLGSMNWNLVGYYEYQVIGATVTAKNGTCAVCGTALVSQNDGQWCDTCKVWIPDGLFT